MKPDGVDTAAPMETLGAEPVMEAPAVEEELQPSAPPPRHEEAAEQQLQQPAETQTAPPAPKEGNSKPADPKAKTKGPVKTRLGIAGTKTTGASGPSARPGAAPNRIVNGVQKPLANGLAKKTNTTAPEKKKLTTATTTTTTAPSKRLVVAPPARTLPKAADRKPVGANRPTTAPTSGTGGTKTATGSAQPNKKVPTAASNGVKAKPKTTAPRPASAAPSKPSSAATAPTKPDRPTVPKTTRPAGVPPASRPAPTTTAAKAAAASAKPSSSRAGATAPPAGRTAAAQPTKATAPAKKDVSRPTAAPAKKPAAAPTRPPAVKPSKPESPKPAATARPDLATKRPAASGKAAEAKPSRPKAQEGKAPAMAEVKASPRAAGPRPGLAKMGTPSPKRPVGSSTPMAVKRASKPTQSVPPLSASGELAKKTHSPKAGAAAAAVTAAAAAAVTAAAVAVVAVQHTAPVEPQQPPVAQSEEQLEVLPPVPVLGEAEDEAVGLPAQQPEAVMETPAAIVAPLGTTVLSPPSSPAAPASLPLEPEGLPPASAGAPQSPFMDEREQEVEVRQEVLVPVAAVAPVSQAAEPEVPVSVPNELLAAAAPSSLLQEQEEAVEKADQEINDDDEEEEEREGSQQVSVSDMSGTQPTEESRPGSAGLAGSMWRGGALLSELDSEEVSGSQQGASELSAPGVLEGTESMDDLGDASLKGADGDGASASSPDIEKVPDIPANEDDDDEDMDMGSERVEDPRRVRHEDEEEDEDVEMASEGVTESGLESYGNADEDDFAEDDRLDNLNGAQLPPPLLPSAPPAQWSQSNPFAEPFSQQPPPAADLLSSPSEPSLADPETPTQSPAQAWLELSTATFVPQAEESTHPQAVQPAPAEQEVPETTPAPPARGMSQSSTLSGTELADHSSSDTSTPEELREYNSSSGVESHSEEKQQQPLGPPPQLDADQDAGVHLERLDGEDEEEAETLPADDLLGGPNTAPASAPSSPSTSGDEASDTEGEMQINEPDAQGIDNIAFDSNPGGQNLPALEEREEAGGEGEEEGGDTPQSANSVASYGFDCTNSNSNAHSTAESCGKSPGIFSLENEDQLPEEAKDPSLIGELTLPAAAALVDLLPLGPAGDVQANPEEQQYMLCGKPGAELPDHSAMGGASPQEPGLPPSAQPARDGPDAQAPYYSTICEMTDNVLSGNV